ncbi:MAG: hypothetical protein U0457_09470 [Candidatus Sericytochromatia bacterium]
MNNKLLKEIISKNIAKNKDFLVLDIIDDDLLVKTLDYLNSEEALTSLEIDPYWPKWFSPWWVMLALDEIGKNDKIPPKILAKLVEKINTHYIHIFPVVESELPPNINPIRNIICHCALGSMYKLLSKSNIDINKKLPWFDEWFEKYQLPDGGFNCDEAVYTKEKPNSSIISSLPILEAILYYKSDLNKKDLEILQKGVNYLLNKKLFKKESNNEIINNNWIKPFFPRFYEYDILRGLKFVTDWALKTKNTLPLEKILDAIIILDSQINNDIFLDNSNNPDITAINSFIIDKNVNLKRDKLTFFPLLEDLIYRNKGSIYLTKEWYDLINNLNLLFNDK